MRSPPLLWYFPYYQHTTVVCGGGGLNKYQRLAADALQPPLRCGWRAQLRRSVDMTSDVKGWEQLFYVCLIFSLLSIGRAGASKTRRLITLISVGWLPPYLHPSGACLTLGTRVPFGLLTLPRVTPNRGCASSERRWQPGKLMSIHRHL